MSERTPSEKAREIVEKFRGSPWYEKFDLNLITAIAAALTDAAQAGGEKDERNCQWRSSRVGCAFLKSQHPDKTGHHYQPPAAEQDPSNVAEPGGPWDANVRAGFASISKPPAAREEVNPTAQHDPFCPKLTGGSCCCQSTPLPPAAPGAAEPTTPEPAKEHHPIGCVCVECNLLAALAKTIQALAAAEAKGEERIRLHRMVYDRHKRGPWAECGEPAIEKKYPEHYEHRNAILLPLDAVEAKNK